MTKVCVLLLALAACACPNKKAGGTQTGSGAGSDTGTIVPGGDTCAAVRPKVEQLYRAEAQAHEPARVDEATADNTAMVMADCEKAPADVVACLKAADSVAVIEGSCLERLDPAGNVLLRRVSP